MRKIVLMLLAVLATLTSCSGDYMDVIPAGSQALVSIDIHKISQSADMANGNKVEIFKSLLHTDDPSKIGIDLSSNMYIFEAADGGLGLVAKVSDKDAVEDFLENLQEEKICTTPEDKNGYTFTTVKDAWEVGISSSAMLVMGPIVASTRAEAIQTMSEYLDGKDKGITDAQIYKKLQTMKSSISVVACTSALPAKIAPLLALGAPKDADPTSVMIALEIENQKGYVHIYGQPFSFDKDINEALKSAAKTYRPIKGNFESQYKDGFVSLFTNVDGNKYIDLVRSDKGLRALMAGLNTLIDADQMIKAINGDMIFTYIPSDKDGDYYQLMAQNSNNDYMGDVSYWQKSLPQGASLKPMPGGAYRLKGDNVNLDFKSTPSLLVMTSNMNRQIPAAKQSTIIPTKGQRFVIFVNPEASQSQTVKTITTFLKPLFGDFRGIVYTLK